MEQLLGEILRQLRANAAQQEELLTKEQVAARLSISIDGLVRRMRDGTLPKGKVWFQPPGLPMRFSWQALCEHYRTAHDDADREPNNCEEDIPQWRRGQ